jgi:hypothetical protein
MTGTAVTRGRRETRRESTVAAGGGGPVRGAERYERLEELSSIRLTIMPSAVSHVIADGAREPDPPRGSYEMVSERTSRAVSAKARR